MKHVKIEVLLPGMITAEDVIGSNKQLILPRGLTLTDKAIARLETYDVKDIRIEDPVGIEVEEIIDEEEETPVVTNIDLPDVDVDTTLLTSDADSILSALAALENSGEGGFDKPAEVAEPTPHDKIEEKAKSAPAESVVTNEEPSHYEKIQSSREFQQFQKSFENNVCELKGQINDIVEKNAPINVDNMLSSTMNLLSTQNNSFGVFDMLHNMRQFDDLTYAHSMNVALICNVFAEWLKFSEDEKKLATACGMLHDIGKLKIDDSIIKKPGKLTDSEFMSIKKHPVEGYKILQHQNISEHIKNAALMHHEKCDGTGYPLRLSAERIDPYAKLVAIADVYDAMTSARVYRGALCPFTVIEIFEEEGLHKYDIVYIMTFLENVINTYIDNTVLLSDGRKGVIKWIDKQNLSKPMVQMTDGSFIELAKYKDLKIIKIL